MRLADAIARRYGTDPYTVLQWGPDRFAAALLCYGQGMEDQVERLKMASENKGMVFPVVVLGGA